jgi:hypothetical protein
MTVRVDEGMLDLPYLEMGIMEPQLRSSPPMRGMWEDEVHRMLEMISAMTEKLGV